MTWPNQNPPATDVILHLNVPCASYGAASPCYLEIDKLADGRYRATVGTLFEHEEVCRTPDLEALIRQANAMAGCRSFDDVVTAFQAMRLLGQTSEPFHVEVVGAFQVRAEVGAFQVSPP